MKWMGVWLIRLSPPLSLPPPSASTLQQVSPTKIMKWMGVWLIPQGWDISPLPPPSASTLRQVSGFPQKKAYSTKRMAVFLILWARDTSPWQITPLFPASTLRQVSPTKGKKYEREFCLSANGILVHEEIPRAFHLYVATGSYMS